jgi:hypothetical protein
MYKVTGYWRESKVVQYFHDKYDAIDFRDVVDAHYPLKVTFEKGVFSVREFIYDCWNGVMDANINPLKKIPHTNTRHMVLQVLAWMWCIVFSSYFGSMWIFGITTIAHIFLLAAIAVTVATFETAKRRPEFFLRLEKGTNGYHTPSRTRYLYHEGKRIELDPRDPGGEHE